MPQDATILIPIDRNGNRRGAPIIVAPISAGRPHGWPSGGIVFPGGGFAPQSPHGGGFQPGMPAPYNPNGADTYTPPPQADNDHASDAREIYDFIICAQGANNAAKNPQKAKKFLAYALQGRFRVFDPALTGGQNMTLASVDPMIRLGLYRGLASGNWPDQRDQIETIKLFHRHAGFEKEFAALAERKSRRLTEILSDRQRLEAEWSNRYESTFAKLVARAHGRFGTMSVEHKTGLFQFVEDMVAQAENREPLKVVNMANGGAAFGACDGRTLQVNFNHPELRNDFYRALDPLFHEGCLGHADQFAVSKQIGKIPPSDIEYVLYGLFALNAGRAYVTPMNGSEQDYTNNFVEVDAFPAGHNGQRIFKSIWLDGRNLKTAFKPAQKNVTRPAQSNVVPMTPKAKPRSSAKQPPRPAPPPDPSEWETTGWDEPSGSSTRISNMAAGLAALAGLAAANSNQTGGKKAKRPARGARAARTLAA